MEMFLLFLTLVLALIGLVGAVVPILPGTILSFLALLVSYLSPRSVLSTGELVWWLLVCVVVTIVDYFLPIYLTKRLGGSKSGVWGATIGMVVGFIAFPPLGIILCPFFGAVMGELLNDKSDVNRALKVGFASFLAFVVGTGLKFATSLWILGLIVTQMHPEVDALIEYIKAIF